MMQGGLDAWATSDERISAKELKTTLEDIHLRLKDRRLHQSDNLEWMGESLVIGLVNVEPSRLAVAFSQDDQGKHEMR